MVLFTTFAGIDPHRLLLESAFERNLSVYFGLPRPVLTYERGYPEIDTLLLPPYMEFVRRVTLDHKFRYSHPYTSDRALPRGKIDTLYNVLKGYYIDDSLTLEDIYFLANYLSKAYYKPLVGIVHNVSKVLAVGVYVQMNRYEKNSTIEDNVKGFEVLAKSGVDVVSVDEGRGLGRGGYFWPTQLTTPISVADTTLDESLHYQYPSMKLNITFDEVFWTSIQEVHVY